MTAAVRTPVAFLCRASWLVKHPARIMPGLAGAALAVLGLGGALPRAQAAGMLSLNNSVAAPVTSSITSNLAAEQQAQAVGVQAQNQLARVTAALQAMQNMQTAAHNLALTAPSPVPDGLQTGGLVPDSGLAARGVANPVVTWTGAQTPVQTSAAGKTTVTVNQTAAQALLNWNGFNVGRNTTVNFNQQGNTDWVALNQIAASGVPSQILGSIKASGQVYLIDQNGIIFGGSSQVDVGTLVASSALVNTTQFMASGSFNANGTYNGIYSDSAGDPSFTNPGGAPGGAIIVQPGAAIATSAPASVTVGGGDVLLMGTQVRNAGEITTPDGQTELAAGDNFFIRPGYSTTANDSSTTRGNEIAVTLTRQGSSQQAGGSGLVENTGQITADTGDITLAGETVQQNGVALSTTSVAVRGTIHLLSSASDPYASITLGSNAFTLVEPELSSTATELDSQREGLIADATNANRLRSQAASGQFDDLSTLGDLEDESRIEIVAGNTVEFQGGSDSSAPGGQIAVSAVNRIQVDNGALLDVSGSYAVPLAMSLNDLAVNIQSYELRDNPQNRLTGALTAGNITVNIDARTLSAVPVTVAEGLSTSTVVNDYTVSGLFEVSGSLGNLGHTIGEYTALGGQIALSTGAAGAIVAQASSTFNIDGGTLQYQGGDLPQSYLLGINGEIYNANSAPADVTYSGVYTGFTVDDARWNVTETYGDALKAPAEIYQNGYTVGRAAGTLTLSSPTTDFNGTLDAGAVNGPFQTSADPAGISDAYLYAQSEVAEPGTLNIALLATATLSLANTNVSFGTQAPPAGGVADVIPDTLIGTTEFGAAAIDQTGLGGLDVITNGSIAITAPLTFAPGAQVNLVGSSIDIAADVTDAGGSVSASQVAPGDQIASLQTVPANGVVTGDIVLGTGASISTAGLFTNLALDPGVTFTQAFIDGGPVKLASINNLNLQSGSLIDASAGGYVGLNYSVKGGPGGAITLEAGIESDLTGSITGNLTLGGRLQSTGATQGGALALYAPSYLISDQPPVSANPALVWLDPAFFTQGFSTYNLQSTGDITVSPGTVINVTEPTYFTTAATLSAPTGASPAAAFTAVLDPLYMPNSTYSAITQRPGASFSAEIVSPSATPTYSSDPAFIGADTISIGTGAAINVDPGQSITLRSLSQLTIDGSLRAPGGTITATSPFNTLAALPGPGSVSIWLGPDAVLNASSQPVSFENGIGDRIGLAPAGGTITLGSNLSTASIIIRAGAMIEASGSATTDEMTTAELSRTDQIAQPVNQAIPVEGAGGAISLASQEGIYNDGSLIAAAGGPQAAGGSLSMTLEADNVPNSTATAEATPRIFTITQADPGPQLPADLQPGASDGLTIGTASISAAQIDTGGFGSVSLFARDAFLFSGDVTLSAAQSISLKQGVEADTSPQGSVTLAAPYVLLSGQDFGVTSFSIPYAAISGYSAQTATGGFTVNATTIDISDGVRFGGVLPADGADANGATPDIDLAGFGTVDLNSRGDLQFLPFSFSGTAAQSQAGNGESDIITTANVDITAREIYQAATPQTGEGSVSPTGALIVAGYDPAGAGSGSSRTAAAGTFNPDGVLNIARTPGTSPVAPDILAGALTFEAATVNQGGVIWQPLGKISLGDLGQSRASIDGATRITSDKNEAVNFLAGSITSVSAAGISVPFGGTTDGVNYNVLGTSLATTAGSFGLASVTGGVAPGTITIAALTTHIQTGATLDLRGGGILTGAGFIPGEGGSVDVLTTPLLNIGSSGVSEPSLANDPVYAIVTGAQPAYAAAYTQSGSLGSTPGLGQQIVIPAGVPGLPGGTYTLLPAQYALEPGGYRVEFDGAAALDAASVTALPNGSFSVAGYTALAATNVRSTLATNLTVTPGATVLNYADYDQESYSAFLVANAARLGEIRPTLPIDAGTLALNLPVSSMVSLIDAGSVFFAAATGGIGGTLQIGSGDASSTDIGLPDFDIYGTTPTAGLPAGTISLSASQIDAFNPFILEIGVAGKGVNAGVDGITLESGATLKAARVVLTAQLAGITLNSGSAINTIGEGSLLVDSSTEGLLRNGGATVLDVGNGYLVYGTTPSAENNYGPITIENGAEIYADGSIAFSTSAAVNIGVNASYGGKYIDLAVPIINIGNTQAPGVNAPAGVALTQAVLQALTDGLPGQGVPAVQILNLTAFDSLNLYGTTSLDLGNANVQLEINTPAIYGEGSASDVASISAGTIVWNGVSTTASYGTVVVSSLPGPTTPFNGPGSGSGTLDLNATTLILGFSDLDIPQRDVSLTRLAAGFTTVNFNASSEIIANNQGSLAVYQTVATYGQPGSGGTLNLNTALLTASDEAIIGLTAGGDISVNPPAGAGAALGLVTKAAGGEIDLTGADIDVDTAVILPSGKLNLQATDNISLGAGALLNLAGVVTTDDTETIYGFGGDLVMESATGDITQAAGSAINVGAIGNTAGSLSVTATAAGAGQVALLGTLIGGSTHGYDSGQFTIRAQNLGDFATLNAGLDSGGFFQLRSFDIAQGDLTIGDGVQAHNVSVSLDNGSLTVNGEINASGNGGGVIDLAASDNLILTAAAKLDAYGTVLQTDSYGQPIESENAPAVSLTAGSSIATPDTGELTLTPGAVIDLASADNVARGDLELYAPRTGTVTNSNTVGVTITTDPEDASLTTGTNGPTSAQGDSVAISAPLGITITGASNIALNGTAVYQNAPSDPNDSNGQIIDQAYLALINTDSQNFINAAQTNYAKPDEAGSIAGLTQYEPIAQLLRPAVEIVSATPTGDLTVDGDIDLSGYRYGPTVNAKQYGSGEPGTLVVRAGGNLNIYGSITDGFATPVTDLSTEFAKGWVVFGNGEGEPFGQNQVLPSAVAVTTGSGFPANSVTNVPVDIADGGSFEADAISPVQLTVEGDQTTTIAFVATSNITVGNNVIFAQGETVPAGSVIPDGAVIAAGGSFPFPVTVGAVTWPANTPLTVVTTLENGNPGVALATNAQGTTSIQAGTLIPAGSALFFPSGDETANTRRLFNSQGMACSGSQSCTEGQAYALAPLLPQGDLSWSISLVAGADTAAAGTSVVQAAGALGGSGNLTLADTHYGITVVNFFGFLSESEVPAFSVIRTGTGSLNMVAGGAFNEDSSYGVYTAGAQSPAILVDGQNPYDLAQGKPSNGTKLPALVANYAAYYPTGGGNVLVAAQGNLNSYIATYSGSFTDTDALGGWLWRQGGAGQPGAWWINFGALDLSPNDGPLQMTGFQGIGTLGGGNLTVAAGGSASGLDLAVGSNGRVAPDATLVQNGGGSLDVTIGEAVNLAAVEFTPTVGNAQDAGGIIADLRGDTSITAGSIGMIQPIYGAVNGSDPRFLSPFASEQAGFGEGFDLAPGDGSVTIDSRGDLAIGNALNPGTVADYVNTTPVNDTTAGVKTRSGGVTDFSLWTGSTSIDLFSAGGDVVPAEGPPVGANVANDTSQLLYTPSLLATAQNGSIYFGQSQELAPSATGELELLAADSIVGIPGLTVSISGADLSLVATPFDPDIQVYNQSGFVIYPVSAPPNSGKEPIDYGYDNPTGPLHAADPQPARVFAATGDIVDIEFGTYVSAALAANGTQQVVAAKPFEIYAGRDIVDSGSLNSPDIFLNLASTDVTSIVAGRDILESSFDIAGPGNLLVQAGRNLYEVDQSNELFSGNPGSAQGIYSLGPLFDINPADRNSGASISVLAGVGNGPDYTGFSDDLLDPAHAQELSNASQIIEVDPTDPALLFKWLKTNAKYTGSEPGMYAYFLSLPIATQNNILSQLGAPAPIDTRELIQGDDATLLNWLQQNAGYTGKLASGAYADFLTLPAGQQEIFLRQFYFGLLNTAGLDYNEPTSPFYKSYLLGKTAIVTLLPANFATFPTPVPPDTGDITLTGNSGVQTQFGGNIEVLTSGGQTIVGVEGNTPGGTAGLITQGTGDIDIYAQDSVLLGESRVITTFGGNILIWSALGDINAGRGSKTTIVYTPVQRVYDNYGDVFLSPSVPSSGAGIATLAPIPGVPAGNINLIAPVGTVDAGEAGIRVSGNFNVAALHVLNTANIQVQGTSTGVPVVSAPNIGSLTSAGNAAGAAAEAAQNSAPKSQAAPQPSIWIVEILGYGGPGESIPTRKKSAQPPGKNLNVSNPFPSRSTAAIPAFQPAAG